ncbi:MAG: MGMT family protein [Candidatus Omnitrophica bacterium]|nr:MGMT family protein [Candidatus Omnitrophota bacterium]
MAKQKSRHFSVSHLRRRTSSEFQLKVLLAVSKIPRGKVASYKKVAIMAGCGKAYRAAGNALAGNPFLITIPCHRVVCSDGSLGGFKKGLAFKKQLLEREGVKLDRRSRVPEIFFMRSKR